MSVVLRCPTCGTTQGDAGECEACSEGEVRYFCTNHDGGVWLNGPVCGSCGAKFGDPPRKPPTPRTSSVPTRPAGAPDFRPPSRRRATEPSSEPDFGRRPRRAEPEEPAEPEVLPRTRVAGGAARGDHRGARARPGRVTRSKTHRGRGGRRSLVGPGSPLPAVSSGLWASCSC